MAIQIDVHPAGETPTNTTRMLFTPVHVRPAYASCGAVPVRGKLPRATDRVGQSHCSQEKWLPTQSTTRRLTDPRVRTQFLSRANQ
jgi:hypothetical protein